MPEKFEGLGIALLYPDNWRFEQEEEDCITLESPGGSFLSIRRLGDKTTPETAIESAKQAMEEEYDAIESEERRYEFAGIDCCGITQRFIYLDLIVAAHWITIRGPIGSYIAQIQGEDREVDKLLPVFEAILTSMCQSMATG